MFDGAQAADTKAGVGLADLQDLLTRPCQQAPDPGADSATKIDQIAALERLKNACAAAQAQLTTQVHADQVARDEVRGLDPAQTARSVGGHHDPPLRPATR